MKSLIATETPFSLYYAIFAFKGNLYKFGLIISQRKDVRLSVVDNFCFPYARLFDKMKTNGHDNIKILRKGHNYGTQFPHGTGQGFDYMTTQNSTSSQAERNKQQRGNLP